MIGVPWLFFFVCKKKIKIKNLRRTFSGERFDFSFRKYTGNYKAAEYWIVSR